MQLVVSFFYAQLVQLFTCILRRCNTCWTNPFYFHFGWFIILWSHCLLSVVIIRLSIIYSVFSVQELLFACGPVIKPSISFIWNDSYPEQEECTRPNIGHWHPWNNSKEPPHVPLCVCGCWNQLVPGKLHGTIHFIIQYFNIICLIFSIIVFGSFFQVLPLWEKIYFPYTFVSCYIESLDRIVYMLKPIIRSITVQLRHLSTDKNLIDFIFIASY